MTHDDLTCVSRFGQISPVLNYGHRSRSSCQGTCCGHWARLRLHPVRPHCIIFFFLSLPLSTIISPTLHSTNCTLFSFNPTPHTQTDGTNSFLRAARAGNLEKVQEYLRGSIDVNTSNIVSVTEGEKATAITTITQCSSLFHLFSLTFHAHT